jgi:uncharacterized protein (TIGR02099 family)
VSKTSKFTALAIRKLWTLIAVLLVLVALFISLLRYSLPMLDERKHVIEEYVATEYGIDLSIGSVSAAWKSHGPTLQLNKVVLRQGEQSPISLAVEDVYLAVEFWPSVFSGKLQSRNVTLSDLDLTVDVQRIEGQSNDFPVVKALESIFMEQLSKFSVTNSRITLVNNKHNSLNFPNKINQNTIRVRQLSWLNKGNRHQGLGELSLQGFASNTASFILDLEGNVDSYNGTLYARGQELDISPWINEFTDLDNNLVTSKGNFVVWGNISEGVLDNVRGQVQPSQFEWTTPALNQIDTRISAEFAANLKEDVWHFALNDLLLKTNDESFTSNWSGRFSQNTGMSVYNRETLDLSSLSPLMALLSQSGTDDIAELNLSLEIPSLHLRVASEGLSVLSLGNRLSWQEAHNMPGVDSINVDAYWLNDRGTFRLHTSNASIASEQLFDRNLSLNFLDMSLQVTRAESSWFMASKQGEMLLDGIKMFPSVSYDSKTSMLSIMTDIGSLPLNQVPSLLPNRYMSDDAKTYLSNAFVGDGLVEEAYILWHGNPQQYPFADDSGVFQASVAISDADFVFSDTWPELNRLNIDLLFENRSLSMKATSGLLAGVELSNLTATIPTLGGGSMLTILADGSSDGQQLAKLMSQSSLKDSLGRVLSENVIVSGPLTTNLALYIPLSDTTKTRAVGEARLLDSKVHLSSLALDFTNANGVIAFDNEKIKINQLQANLFEQAVAVDLSGKREDLNYLLDINVAGNWGLDSVLNQHAPKLSPYLSGSADWDLSVDVSLQEESYLYEAQLSSMLSQIDSSLPSPFEKAKDSDLELKVLASGNNTASSIELQLGEDVKFEGALPHKEKQFSRAHLALGKTDFVGMGVGFSISANLPSIDADRWTETVKALVGDLRQSERSILSAPERIFAEADQVLLSGIRITDVNATAKQANRNWQIDIDSDQVRGTVDISDQWVSEGVRVDADYVKLNDVDFSIDATEKERQIVPQNLPAIKFNCASCEVADVHLGRVTFEAEPNDDGLEITRLLMETKNGSINALGQWYKRHNDHYTFLAGDLSSGDLGLLLADFDFDSGVKDSQANVDFALTWRDSPMDFGFEHLDGQIDWDLTDGYLTEVSDKGSRIFTLLSLDSLVRKLSLDFRDVFAKGFFYDEMSGSVQITEGKADTRDTKIDGGAGDIEIYGYTDLVSKELNYNVSFAPNVTGNLPVLVYFFSLSPPSALAALAIDQVLTSTKVISNVNYSVTGTLTEPVLIETGRQSTEVELPTRRALDDENLDPEFIPPSAEDLLKVERSDG